MLDKLLNARHRSSYGQQNDYFDDPDLIGWTREGHEARPDSGLAVLLTNRTGGTKKMSLGKRSAGKKLRPILSDGKEILLDEEGSAEFTVPDGGVEVWTVAAGVEE